MLRLFWVIIFIGAFMQVKAQEITGTGGVILRNAKPVDKDRYKEIEDSPYMYRNFVNATLYKSNNQFIKDLPLNYNGHTGNFEYQKNGNIYELDNEFFVKIEIVSEDYNPAFSKNMSDSVVFIKGLNPDDYEKFYILVEGGVNATVFKEFTSFVSKRKIENVGKTIVLKTFGTQFLYYMVQGKSPELLKLRKKSILDLINNQEVEAFVQNQNIKLNSEEDLKKTISFFNQMDVY